MSDEFPALPTPPHGDDRVRDTLTLLRGDAELTRLADASSVRRRGETRNRNQALAAVAAACVVVVIVVGSALGISGTDKSQTHLPASPVPTAPALLTKPAADPFLKNSDVGTIGVYENFQRSPGPFRYQAKLVCMRGPGTWGADEHRSQQFFSNLDATFYEHVLHYPNQAAASAGVHTVLAQLGSCEVDTQHPKRIAQRGPLPVAGAPGSTRASWLSKAEPDSEVYYYELGIQRTGNVLVVLEWSSMGNPEHHSGWAWTADRLNLAADRATT
jgi:hypothetical protein